MKTDRVVLMITIGIVAGMALAVLVEDYITKGRPQVCNAYLAHVEIHSDRPLDEAIKETAYDRAPQEQRDEYDRREIERESDCPKNDEGGRWS